LSELRGVRLLGRPPGSDRTGVLAFIPASGDPELEWVPLLRQEGVVARGGLHCSPRIHQQAGASTVRFSVSRFTTEQEIDVALRAVGHVADLLEAVG